MSRDLPRFDDALPRFVAVVTEVLGQEPIERGDVAILRDAAGLLTLILRKPIGAYERSVLDLRLSKMTSYVDASGPTATPQELFDSRLADRERYRATPIKPTGSQSPLAVLIADRRIVGTDWLSKPRSPVRDGATPILAFASLKGGVGRSTALSIVARDLADTGMRVLAIDLDLEAPGLGSMLLDPQIRPSYGSLDFFVERGGAAFTDIDFTDLMEASTIASAAAPVHVVPAFGRRSLENPENVLGKIARAYLEDVSENGATASFLDRTRTLVDGLLSVRDFDVVLVDTRAGLHETLAASILGLGADVLLFGINQPQTFEGYRALLAHLAHVAESDSDFALRLRMVQGKADPTDLEDIRQFRDRAHALFAATIYGRAETTADEFETKNATWFGVDDPNGPHFPWIVVENETYRRFDPFGCSGQLNSLAYREPFGRLVAEIRHLLDKDEILE